MTILIMMNGTIEDNSRGTPELNSLWFPNSNVKALYKCVYKFLNITEEFEDWSDNFIFEIISMIDQDDVCKDVTDEDDKHLIANGCVSNCFVEMLLLSRILKVNIKLSVDSDENVDQPEHYHFDSGHLDKIVTLVYDHANVGVEIEQENDSDEEFFQENDII